MGEASMKLKIMRARVITKTMLDMHVAGAVALAGIMSIVAVGGSRAAEVVFKPKSPLTIGYSIQSAQDPYWQGYVAGIQTEMKKYGFVKLLTQDSQASPQKQVSGSLALLNSGISCLVISPQEPRALAPTILAAHRQHVPVVVGDVGATGNYDGFVQSDNYHGGVLAAEFIDKQLASRSGVQEVALIALNPTTSVNKPRTDGFTDTIAKNPNIKVVANISGGQTLEGGFKAAQAILAAHPKVSAIYTLNDSMAAGAQQAIQQAGGNGMSAPILVGFNGDQVALDLLKKKAIAADVVQSPYKQGIIAVDICWTLLNGQTPPYTDGATKTADVPVNLITPDTTR